MATLNEIEELLEDPVATEEYAAALEAALLSIADDNSVRALALRQIGEDILDRVNDILGDVADPDNFLVTKDGKVYLEPGTRPIRVPDVSAEHEVYVLHTTHNVVGYDDGIPDDVADIFAGMRDD